MGNIATYDCKSICGLNFLTTQDLRKTSLQGPPMRPNKPRSHTATTAITVQSTNTLPSFNNLPNTDTLVYKKCRSAEDNGDKPLGLKRSNTCHLIRKDSKEKPHVTENDFRILQMIADGRYGRICLVKKENQEGLYIMKILSKKRIENSFYAENYLIEKEILEKSNHPFIPKLSHYFENDKKIFLVTEHIGGGQLQNILQQLNQLSEEITKFYTAEVLLALEYLHETMDVAYNALNSENILLDAHGHIKLIDFTRAQKLESPKTMNISRSISSDSPSKAAKYETTPEKIEDYWSLGCFIYELLTGKRLVDDGDKYDEVDKTHLQDGLEWPQFITKQARDLITRLLNPKTEERLGFNGICEIKKHAFFSHICWERMKSKSVYPPLNPSQFVHKTSLDEEDEGLESEVGFSNICSIAFVPEMEGLKREPSTSDALVPDLLSMRCRSSREDVESMARSL